MPLTPDDIRNVTFSKPSIGKRGYSEDEVDAFLDLVSTELARASNENADLHKRIDQLILQLRTTQAEAEERRRSVVTAAPPADDHGHAAKVLGMAQQIADRLAHDAKVDAERTLSQTQTTNQRLVAEARTKADSMINEARSRADTLLRDAQARAETVDRQAREKAATLERDATRKHTETLGAISLEKDALQRRVDELRTFEREYRTRLQTYLTAQLRELENRDSVAPAEAIPNQRSFSTPGFDGRTAENATVLLRNAG